MKSKSSIIKVLNIVNSLKIKNFKLKIKPLLLLVLLCCLFNLIFPIRSFAAGNFTTDYNVTYSVKPDGTTHANLSIILINKSAQYYASSYQMNLGFADITNIVASDSAGVIKTNVSKVKDGYNMSLAFNKKALGLGSSLPFNLSFDTTNIAKHTGKIWEINIPGISNPSEFSGFTVHVNAPSSFGSPTIIKPSVIGKNLIFNKSQLGKSGISIAFGEGQIYDFNLTYHLRNTNVYPIKTEIALPPGTNYQKVYIDDIVPKPSNVTLDQDGNWLAQYSLAPTEKKDVKVIGKAEIFLNPKNDKADNPANYIKKTSNWQSEDPKIKQIALELKTPEAIYNYVVKTLKYDFKRAADDKKRFGAVSALNNVNSAVCLEFTDLFIALSRAAGIPAREIDGFAYTENSKLRPISYVQDVLHAWPEYYDSQKKAWIMVDPTWGSTTGGVDYFNVMDFDHFAFAIKGIDDSYPAPAGGYKYDENKNTKDVRVTFSSSSIDKKQHVKINDIFSSTQVAGLPMKDKLRIYNSGPSEIFNQAVTISSQNLTPREQAFEMPPIPPFGYRDLDIAFVKTNILTNRTDTITIRFGEQKYVKTVKIAPFFLTIWGAGGIAFVIFTITILIIAGKSRRLRLHR